MKIRIECKLKVMRIKSILLLILCICLSTVFYCLLVGDPKPTINTIHKQFNHFKGVVINNNYNYNNIYINTNNNNNNDLNSEESERNCDKYLRLLGFKRNKTQIESNVKTVESRTLTSEGLATVWPVFVTAIKSDQLDLAKGFVRSFEDNVFNNYSLIIYDLGLNRRQILEISSICNETQNTSRTDPSFDANVNSNNKSWGQSPIGQTLCTIRRFDYQLFPSHVSDLKLSAFRPLILQLLLNEFGSALWLDPNYYLIPTAGQKVQRLAERAKKEGIMSWTIDQPTSSLTHPRMFEYFKTIQNQYYFHRMIRASHLLIYNTARIHTDLMLPWIKCVLTHECIAPIGSQSSGCRFDKKPLYRYSGCHNYDTSALNVILGQMFDFDEKPYSAAEDDKFFRVVTIDDDSYITETDIIESDYISNSYIRGRLVSTSSLNRNASYSSSAKISAKN